MITVLPAKDSDVGTVIAKELSMCAIAMAVVERLQDDKCKRPHVKRKLCKHALILKSINEVNAEGGLVPILCRYCQWYSQSKFQMYLTYLII